MRRAKQLLFFEPLLWQILSAIRRCIGRASQRVWVYSDQTSRCRGDLLRLPLRKIVVVARVFLTFLIWEAFVGVGLRCFQTFSMRPRRCPVTVTRKAHGTMSVIIGVRRQSRHRQQQEAIEGDQVCALGARGHPCRAGYGRSSAHPAPPSPTSSLARKKLYGHLRASQLTSFSSLGRNSRSRLAMIRLTSRQSLRRVSRFVKA